MTDPAPPHGSNVKEDPQNNEPQETMYQSPLATESKPWTRILKSHASTVSEVNSVASSSETNSDENETETETGTSVVSGEPGFSLHGIGLLIATERAQRVTRAGRQCAALIFDVATYYESFSQTLSNKSSPQPPSSSTTLSSQQQLSTQINVILSTTASNSQQLCTAWQQTVARPWHATLQPHTEGISALNNKYWMERRKAVTLRTRALKARDKLRQVAMEADALVQTSLSDKDQGTLMDKLPFVLQDVKTAKITYEKLVEEANLASHQVELEEQRVLQTLEDMEQERLQVAFKSIELALAAIHSSFAPSDANSEGETAAAEASPISSQVALATGTTKKSNPLFKLLKSGASQLEDEAVGLMEAETLGLDQYVGKLRDEVKTCLKEREKRMQMVKALATCLEDVAVASSVLATSVANRLSQVGYGDGQGEMDSLSAFVEQDEGPNLRRRWTIMIDILKKLVSGTESLAANLRTIRQERLDGFLLVAEKQFKALNEGDDTRWKALCEAARNETRAQARYEKASEQSGKARERAQSAEEDDDLGPNRERTNSGAAKIPQGMKKALGNVFSILPDGGEKAMKMMGSDTRRALMQTHLDEADQRESKNKTSWEQAVASKGRAVESYKSAAEKTVESLSREEATGWKDVGEALLRFISSLKAYSDAFLSESSSLEVQGGAISEDFVAWTNLAKEQLNEKLTKIGDGDAVSASLVVDHSLPVKVSKLFDLMDISQLSNTTNTGTAYSEDNNEGLRNLAREIKEKLSADEKLKLEKPSKVMNGRHTQAHHTVAEPTDIMLEKMEVVLNKTLVNVSVNSFYEVAWSEGQQTSEKAFFGPWLASLGAENLTVGPWAFEEALNPWTQETFSQKRVVSFDMKRKIPLGSPVTATVIQTHYCKRDDSKCIIEITVELKGIPYADCFSVEVRWVATQAGRDLKVNVGLFVVFNKSTMFANQIRSGASKETKEVHFILFERIKAECHAGEAEEEEIRGEGEVLKPGVLSLTLSAASEGFSMLSLSLSHRPIWFVIILFILLNSWMRNSELKHQIGDLQNDILSMREELILIRTLLEKGNAS